MEAILETAIIEMGRLSKGKSFSPEDVAKWMYPTSWEYFLEDVEETMMEMYRAGKIAVLQHDKAVATDVLPDGPVRIKLLSKTKSAW
ncbi:MAG TPA: DUF3253 domain-containing protein [Cyclobacteriaceae bacterium]|nr:DUF3253 domain-containing protein [Cyclobacteriaceae bacterium]